MAITVQNKSIVNNLPRVALSGNAFWVEAYGFSVIDSSYRRSRLEIEVIPPSAGETFIINFKGRSIEYVFSSGSLLPPYAYPHPLPIYDSNWTMEQYWQIIADALNINEFLANNYTITVNNNNDKIIIEAVKDGSEYDVLSYSGSAIGYWTIIAYSYVAPSRNPTDYKMGFQVLKKINDTFLPLGARSEIQATTQYHGANFSLSGAIDISEYLKQVKSGHFSFPFQEVVMSHQVADIIKCYVYVKGINEHASGINSTESVILHGRVTRQQQSVLNDTNLDWWTSFSAKKQFLTNIPTRRQTDPYRPEKLYAYLHGENSIVVKIKENTFQGLEINRTLQSFSLPSVVDAKTQVFEIDASFLNVTSYASDDIESYEIWVESNGGSVLIQPVTFNVDYSYYTNARYFLYKNRFGMYETIRFTGPALKKFTSEKDFVKRSLPRGHNLKDRKEKQISHDNLTIYQVNGGNMTREEANRAQEFLESDDVYWLRCGNAYPVIIFNSDNILSTDENYINTIDFEVGIGEHNEFAEYFDEIEVNLPVNPADYDFDFNDDFLI